MKNLFYLFNIPILKNLLAKNLFAFLTLLLFLLPQYACNTTEPTDELKPGRRDYIWTVDTLNTQMNRIQSIWGSSPNDVWAVGPGGLSAKERVWHFDGNVWQPYQQVLPIAPECIYGTDPNNIWIGGNDANIYRFNGSDCIKEINRRKEFPLCKNRMYKIWKNFIK